MLLLALTLAPAAARAQDGDDPTKGDGQAEPAGPVAPAQPSGDNTLVVPAVDEPPVLDGKTDDLAWKDAPSFRVKRGEELLGHGRVVRCGRELYVAYSSELSPIGIGIGLAFHDEETKRNDLFMISPVNPPVAPILALREIVGNPPTPLGIGTCALRFDLSRRDGFVFEVRIPLDLVNIPRAAAPYEFRVEVWNVITSPPRKLGVWPEPSQALGNGNGRLAPVKDWGVGAELSNAVVDEFHELIEQVARDRGGDESVLYTYTGWRNGRRRDEPLAEMEARYVAAIEAHPDYATLYTTLAQIRKARNDFDGALAAHEALGEAIPAAKDSPYYPLARSELLQALGRYAEAAELLRGDTRLLELSRAARADLKQLDALSRSVEAAKEMRAADAARDDLPRARVAIAGKGAFVLELFEDDAPNAVANFISLAEAGVYEGTRFHWVDGGRGAIGGDVETKDDDPDNDGFGDPGYLIEPEPSRRLNLRYTIAFSDKRRQRQSEGSTFILNISAAPARDGHNSVFGRVIEGADIVDKIEYYDRIESVKIVRKREHPYEPVRRQP